MLVGTVETSFLILVLVIVFGPIMAERFGVPGIVGLIGGGMVFGPFVLEWLGTDGLVEQLGAIGILYLMFLAGLSFDIRGFIENRNSAMVYGLLGFFVPFLLSTAVVLALGDVDMLGSALIGSMWASNTLVAYPEVKAAGLQSNRAVSAAVSAGVVADLMALTVLAFATATAVIEAQPLPDLFDTDVAELIDQQGTTVVPTTPEPYLPLWIALPLLAGFCLWLLPRLADLFFVHIGQTRMQRFVFSLVGMAAGATVALLGGVEGLIGAFLAGLGMNRLVPAKGPLMERIDFVGTAIFVPAFLVSIGLSIDPRVLIEGETLVLGLIFTSFVVVGKTIAALVTGVIFKLTRAEIGLMSSLSFGQAASTLAIAQVGFGLGMFGQNVVNAAVLAIVATALITSYGTRHFIGRVPRPVVDQAELGERVLLDVRDHGGDLDSTVALAASLARPDDGLVVPYGVTIPGELSQAKVVVDHAVAAVAAKGLDAEGVVRVDDSFADGTIHLVEEHNASLVMLAWSGPRFASDYMFGNDIDAVGEQSPVPTMAVRMMRPWHRIVLTLGDLSSEWRQEDARLTLAAVRRLRRSVPVPVLLFGPDLDLADGRLGHDDEIERLPAHDLRQVADDVVGPDDLVVVPAHVLHDMTPVVAWRVGRLLPTSNLAVIAGPHRLSVSRGVTRRPLASTVTASTAQPG